MDDARDAVAMRIANLAQRGSDRLGGGQVGLDHGHAVNLAGLAVQSDDLIVARQPLRDRTAQIARRTGQQDDWSHNVTPCSSSKRYASEFRSVARALVTSRNDFSIDEAPRRSGQR